MKYLMLDTNIYIDMVVARNGSHKADSYYQLKKLLDYGEIKLIVPNIVITEVFRHIDNEIDKVGHSINEIKKRANDLYWINHNEELEKFNKILTPAKSSINKLVDEFNGSSEEYKKKYRELLNKLYINDNCFIIEENEHIVFKAMQRSIYKNRPFHYGGKDNDKDSIADAIIIETLINIKSIIDISHEDCIYFISRNPVDFSVDKSQNKNLLHKDILSSIEEQGMNDIVKYSTLFTNTLLQEFKAEIEAVGLTEELEAEAEYERRLEIQESYELQDDYERESVGLSSLSTDYEEIISELDDVVNFMQLIEEIKEEIVRTCDEYYDKYYELEELVANKSLEELQAIINNNPLIQMFIDDCEDEDEVKYVINELIQWKIGDEDYADFREQIKVEDFFSINNTLFTFSDGFKNEYKLVSAGYISPGNGDEDTISINLYKGDKFIEEGCINIYYGFIEYDDGNVGDGAEEYIAVNIDKLLSQLIDIKEDIIKELNIRTTKFQSLIEMLS